MPPGVVDSRTGGRADCHAPQLMRLITGRSLDTAAALEPWHGKGLSVALAVPTTGSDKFSREELRLAKQDVLVIDAETGDIYLWAVQIDSSSAAEKIVHQRLLPLVLVSTVVFRLVTAR